MTEPPELVVHHMRNLRCPGVYWFKEVREAGCWRCNRSTVAEPPLGDVQRGPLPVVARVAILVVSSEVRTAPKCL